MSQEQYSVALTELLDGYKRHRLPALGVFPNMENGIPDYFIVAFRALGRSTTTKGSFREHMVYLEQLDSLI